jgi:hypothetical protein
VRAAHDFSENLGATRLLEGIHLQIESLVLGADPGVSDFHCAKPLIGGSLLPSTQCKSSFVFLNEFFEPLWSIFSPKARGFL